MSIITIALLSTIGVSGHLQLVAAPLKDRITGMHVESILKKHMLEYTEAADLGWHEFLVSASSRKLADILDKEAPASMFLITGPGRPDSAFDFNVARWPSLTGQQILGRSLSPFPWTQVCRAERLVAADVQRVTFFRRKYLGSDLGWHVGFDLQVEFRHKVRRFQIYDKGRHRFVSDISLGSAGSTPIS